jgi:long-subunit fatty acid transport protein
LSGTVGFLWNPAGGFNVGGVYRYGPKFDYINQVNYISRTLNLGPPYTPPFYFNTTYNTRDQFKVPDIWGLGLSYRTAFGLTAAADFNYVMYSQLPQNVTTVTGDTWDANNGNYATFKMDNAYEIHAGLEWAFALKETPMALRAGYTFKQAHGLYKDPDPSISAAQNSVNSYINQKGDDENIFSAGFGIVLFKNLQLDFSGAWVNLSTEYIGSFVIRF